MPSFNDMKRIYGSTSTTIGQQLKESSDMVMQETWNNDIQTRTCYLYDYYHDNEKEKETGYTPNEDSGKIKVDLKFIVKEYKSAAKDDPEYHIQFSPEDWNNLIIPQWFKDDYGKYGIHYPIGLYVDIPDDKGVYWKWIIFYEEVANQFTKIGVIKCNYLFRWVINDGVHRYKRFMWGTQRNQNSYTSGKWSADKTTQLDDQDKFWLPWNAFSSELKHDQRIIMSMLQKDPLVYSISKIKNASPKGIVEVTMVQTEFNSSTDYVDMNTGEMYADYYVYNNQEPTIEENPFSANFIELSCSLAQIKIGGGYKTIIATCFNDSKEDITDNYEEYIWNYYIDDVEVTENIITVPQEQLNKVKIKLNENIDEEYLGKVLLVKCSTESNIVGELKMSIMAL